jgi:alkylation response protein AidB-like acyl-CoA dehydrogenase
MEFTFSDEQEALRSSVAAYVADAAAAGAVRDAVAGDPGAHERVWSRMVELGWPALLVPSGLGGLGRGLVDAVPVLEETGRAAFPGPYLSSAVIATLASIALGLDDLLVALATGDRRATVALEESGHGDPVERVRARATQSGAHWRLSGVKPLVLDPGADVVLVAARTDDGLASFLLDDPQCEPVETLDLSRAVGRLDLEGRTATRVGPVGDHRDLWARVVDGAAIALAAELLGVCEAAFAMSVAYAEQRIQFDVPISSHQVVQHKFVDMLHRFELGRVGVYHAAWAFDTGSPELTQSVAIAKSTMGDAGVHVTGECIQVHGAAGFTWDSDAHVLYRRAKQNDVLYGARSWQQRRIGAELLAR